MEPLPISPSLPTKSQNLQNKQDLLSRFLLNFQNKAILFAIFIVFLPFFASKAPDFVKQTLSNRIWELFHLLLVGIAVSYGLFSRKLADPETEEEITPKPDNSQNYISDILDRLPVFNSGEPDNLNFQAWGSTYNPNEPLVVVENESIIGNSRTINKPLHLPIRSLKPITNGPKLEGEELSKKLGDTEASDSTDMRGDFNKSCHNFLLKSESEKFNYESNSVPSKSKYFPSLSMKEMSNNQKITPINFKCEQKCSNSTDRLVRRVKSQNNSMDELFKALEECSDSEGDESKETGYDFEKNESCNEEENSSCVTEDSNEENEDNEVDKKADEFIAKFREQIRKQRILGKKRLAV